MTMSTKQAHYPSDEEMLRELQERFKVVVALGVINSENAEAKLAEISPQKRTQLKAQLKQHVAGVPIGTAQPEAEMD